jgi:hypothetical protein
MHCCQRNSASGVWRLVDRCGSVGDFDFSLVFRYGSQEISAAVDARAPSSSGDGRAMSQALPIEAVARGLRGFRGFREGAWYRFEIAPPSGWASFRIRTVTLIALPEIAWGGEWGPSPARPDKRGDGPRAVPGTVFWFRINDAKSGNAGERRNRPPYYNLGS